MQDSFIQKTNEPRSNKKYYLTVAAIAVVAVVGVIGCGYMQRPISETVVISQNTEVPHYIKNMWFNWKAKYNRGFEVFEEEDYRMGVFAENVQKLQDWAAEGPKTYKLAINEFADLTQAEFAALYTSPMKPREKTNIAESVSSDLPASINWITNGAVNDVKNQGQCGSCWAFSAVAAMEGLYFQTAGNLKSFSEQQLVDCSKTGGNAGCNGGLMDNAFTWYEQGHKIDLESDYSYTAEDGYCKESQYTGVFANTGFVDVPETVVGMKTALSMHVVSVAIEADKLCFQFYSSGVLKDESCGDSLDHGVTAVGYGTDSASGEDYWLVRNSWGAGWGDEGYIKMAMNVDWVGGQCGILKSASYPTA